MKVKPIVFVLFNLIAAVLPLAAIDFLSAETEHFTIVFQERDREGAALVRSLCEAVYDDLSGFYKYEPKKITLWVRQPGWDQGFGDFVTGAVTLNIHANEANVRSLMTHELAHYFMFHLPGALTTGVGGVFGEPFCGYPAAATNPLWVSEGAASFLQERFCGALAPWWSSSENMMIIKALVLERKLFSLDEAGFSSVYWPDFRFYRGGYLLFQHIADKYGPAAVRLILEKVMAFPFLGPWNAVQEVTGRDAGDLYRDMAAVLEKRYEKDALIPAGELVSPAGAPRYRLPVLTERGWYLYRRTLDDAAGIVLFDDRTMRETVLIEGADEFTASADGSLIVFAKQDWITGLEGGNCQRSDLYAYDANAKTIRPVTRNGRLRSPVLLPDGRRAVALLASGVHSRLVEVDLADGSLRLLYGRENGWILSAAVSPDGRSLAFIMDRNGRRHLYLLPYPEQTLALDDKTMPDIPASFNADAARCLTGNGPSREYDVGFAGNGRVLFSSDAGGAYALYLLSLADNTCERVLDDPVGALGGRLLPDGGILYGTYTAQGEALKKKAASALLHEPAVFAPPEDGAAVDALPREAFPSAAFWDAPVPRFWLPYPSLMNLFTPEFNIGIGVFLFGGGVTGIGEPFNFNSETNTHWGLSAAFHPLVLQPLIDFDFYCPFLFGYLSLGAHFGYAYVSGANVFRQTNRDTLSFQVPVLRENGYGFSVSLTPRLGAAFSQTIEQPSNFGFYDGLPVDEVSFSAGADFSVSKSGGTFDIYHPFEFTLGVSGRYVPPFDWQAARARYDAGVTAGLQFPSPIRHQVFKLSVDAGCTDGPLGGPSDRSPRGGLYQYPRLTSGEFLASLEYKFPVAFPDLPLILGMSLSRIEGYLYLEKYQGFDLAGPGLSGDNDLYCGAGIIVSLKRWKISGTLTLGAVFRFDQEFRRAPDFARDLAPYWNWAWGF